MLIEEKVRRVRTAAGIRRFAQPIGSIIVRDFIPRSGRSSNRWNHFLGGGNNSERRLGPIDKAPDQPQEMVARPAKKPSAAAPTRTARTTHLKPAESEYEGWDKFVATDGEAFYVTKDEQGEWVYTDADGEPIGWSSSRAEALAALREHTRPASAPTPKPKATKTPTRTSSGVGWRRLRNGPPEGHNPNVIPDGYAPMPGRAPRYDYNRDYEPADDELKAAAKLWAGRPIPPAWTDVVVRKNIKPTDYHIASGLDKNGKRQPLYTNWYRQSQDAQKMQRVAVLETKIDALDKALTKDALTQEVASAVLLSRKLGFRNGNEKEQLGEVEAFGVTQLLAKHVKVNGNETTFTFIGKKGIPQHVVTKDPLIAKAMRARLKGKGENEELFPSVNDNTTNAYLKSVVGSDYKVKDLRTLFANVLAAMFIAEYGRPPKNKTEFNKWRNEVADQVSSQLGNTRSVALASYINPAVFDMWLASIGA